MTLTIALDADFTHAPTGLFASSVVEASGETPVFAIGDNVRVLDRAPVGHYRVPIYLRGKSGVVDRIIRPAGINNEEEAFGRNAGQRRHYYRVAFAMADVWAEYPRNSCDRLYVEIFESWLELIRK